MKTTLFRFVFACLLALNIFVSTSIASAQTPPGQEPEVGIQVTDAAKLYREGKLSEAIVLLEGLEKRNPQNVDVLAWLGFVYVRNNEPAKAVPVLERALALRPRDLETLNNLGNAYAGSGQADKAIAQYQAMSALNPKMSEPYYNMGNIELGRKAFQKAIDYYREAILRKSDDAFSFNNLGAGHEGLKQYDRAASAYGKASSLRPDIPLFGRNAGFALLRLRQQVEAIPYLERAIKDPKDKASALALAEIYQRAKKPKEALRIMEALKDELTDNGPFWFNLGVMRNLDGNSAGAEAAYRKAMEINPNDADVLNNLGLVLFRKGDYPEATTMFQRLVGMKPESISAKLNLAACYARQNDYAKAVEYWKEYVRQDPNRIDVRLDLANALWQLDDKQGARFHYTQVLSLDKNNVVALNGMGLFFLSESKLTDAERLFRQAMASKKDFMPPYNNLAITLERANKRPEAIKVLESALKINPGFEEARKNLERMRAARPGGTPTDRPD